MAEKKGKREGEGKVEPDDEEEEEAYEILPDEEEYEEYDEEEGIMESICGICPTTAKIGGVVFGVTNKVKNMVENMLGCK
jgi:hypothetical protein